MKLDVFKMALRPRCGSNVANMISNIGSVGTADKYQDVDLSHLQFSLAAAITETGWHSQIKEELPEDGEQDSLQAVRDDTCFEAAAEKT